MAISKNNNLNNNNQLVFNYLKIEYFLIAATHLSYVIYFAVKGFSALWIYNIIVFILYGVWIVLISYSYYMPAMYLLFGEILFQTVLTSCLIGNNCGFNMFNFIILVPAIFRIEKNGTIVPQRHRSLFIVVVVDMISFFAAHYVSLNFEPVYKMTADAIGKLYCFNTVVSFVSVTYMGYKLIYDMYENSKIVIEKNNALLSIANIDPLTQLLNRRSMETKLAHANNTYSANGIKFSVLMMDIDFFKSINDNYGHSCGDEVLKTVSNIISKNLRYGDSACRWGGEEFLLLLKDTGNNEALSVAERIRRLVENSRTEYEGASVSYTITIGVATINAHESVEQLINRADEKLYVGKKNGRNRVVI